jgi:hypothetical protein
MSMVVSIAGCVHDVSILRADGQRPTTHLVVERVGDVPPLEREHEPHRVGHASAEAHRLLACHADVNEHPENKTRPKLVERLDVERTDAWVQLTADEELPQSVSTAQRLIWRGEYTRRG